MINADNNEAPLKNTNKVPNCPIKLATNGLPASFWKIVVKPSSVKK